MSVGRVVVLRQYGFLAVEEVELPDPADRQIAVELLAAGIQPAQVRQVQASDDANWRALVPGVEGVGRVTAIGAAVLRASVGDLVVIGPDAASADGPVQAATLTFDDGSVQDGQAVWTWATNVVVDERFATVVPAELAMHQEALAILGGTAITAAAVARRTTGIEAGDTVAVLGCGGLGLATISACKASGAARIVAVAAAACEDAARNAGATEFVSADDLPVDLGTDRAIDCNDLVGGEALSEAFRKAAGSAKLVAADAMSAAIDRDADFAAVTEWIGAGSFAITTVAGRRYTIEEINEAILHMEDDPPAGLALLILEPLR